MTNKTINEIADFILTFILNRTGNNLLDKWRDKNALKKILVKDIKNIQRLLFCKNTELYRLIENYIICIIFTDPYFYSSEEIDDDQQAKIWNEFLKYIKKETGDNYIDINCKEKIVRCVNLHNKAINNIVFDLKTKKQIEVMERNNKKIMNSLNSLIGTFEQDTKLQMKNIDLDYLIKQIEKALLFYKYEITHLRIYQLVYLVLGVIFFLVLCFSSTKIIENTIIDIISYFALVIYLMLVFGALLYILNKKITELESKIKSINDELLDIHKKIYIECIKRKININIEFPE